MFLATFTLVAQRDETGFGIEFVPKKLRAKINGK